MKKRYFIISLLVILGGSIFFAGASRAEDAETAFSAQSKAFANSAGFDILDPKDPRQIVSLGIGISLSLLGIMFTAYLIYGGYAILVSRGEEDKVTKGKKVITTSIIGLVIILSAYAITRAIFIIATGDEKHSGSYAEIRVRDYQPSEAAASDPLAERIDNPSCWWIFCN